MVDPDIECRWQQLGWIRPEAYIAESDYGFLTFVTADKGLLAAVCKGLATSSG